MAIRIETVGGHLDLHEGCRIEMDLRSPILSDLGSQSAVVTLPATARNRSLLSHPARIDAAVRNDTFDGWLSDGPFRRQVRINVVSASESGIEVSLGTDESLMYESWQDTPLRDTPNLPVYTPQGEAGTDPLDSLISLSNDIYHRRRDDTDFRIFPVATEFTLPDDADADTVPVAFILNEVKEDATAKRTGALHGSSLVFRERTIRQGTNEDDLVTVPKGYGITPFIRVCRLLHILFEAYGYELQQNVFDTDAQLSELVLLNNTADTITAGHIDYRDLLPSVTVNDLLESLRARFGAVFYLDAASRMARCILLRDTFSSEPDLDILPLHTSRPEITMNAPQMLVLSDAGTYQTGETATDDMNTFMERFSGYIDITAAGFPALLFDRFTQTFLRRDTAKGTYGSFSSMLFPWKRSDAGFEEYAVTSKDHPSSLYSYRGTSLTEDGQRLNLAALPLYLSGTRNAHTAIKTSSAFQTDETLEQDTDLSFCFAHGIYLTPDGYDFGLQYGSPYSTAPDGTHFMTPSGLEYLCSLTWQGEDGCYSRFWKEFDTFLRYANRTVETTLSIDLATAVRLDLSRPKEMSGQLLLPDTLQYSMPFRDRVGRTSSFRTMRPMDPHTDTDTFIYRITRPAGYWYFSSDVSTVRQRLLSIIRSWLESAYPDRYEITEISEYTHRRTILPDLRCPTAEQLSSHAVRRTGYTLTIRVEYDYYASSLGGPRQHSWTEEFGSVTETYEATAYSGASAELCQGC